MESLLRERTFCVTSKAIGDARWSASFLVSISIAASVATVALFSDQREAWAQTAACSIALLVCAILYFRKAALPESLSVEIHEEGLQQNKQSCLSWDMIVRAQVRPILRTIDLRGKGGELIRLDFDLDGFTYLLHAVLARVSASELFEHRCSRISRSVQFAFVGSILIAATTGSAGRAIGMTVALTAIATVVGYGTWTKKAVIELHTETFTIITRTNRSIVSYEEVCSVALRFADRHEVGVPTIQLHLGFRNSGHVVLNVSIDSVIGTYLALARRCPHALLNTT